VWHRPDDHVLVFGGLDQMIDRGAECAGKRDQLVEADATLARLDSAQRGRAQVAPSGERVEAPPTRQPQSADALTDYVRMAIIGTDGPTGTFQEDDRELGW
jgi:hypothetical protein